MYTGTGCTTCSKCVICAFQKHTAHKFRSCYIYLIDSVSRIISQCALSSTTPTNVKIHSSTVPFVHPVVH